MADYKGVGIVFVRRLVREAGVEGPLVAGLTDDERSVYESVTGNAWVPIELATKCFVLAAPLVFPTSPNAVREIGRGLARDNISRVYRVMMRVVTVEFLVNEAAKLWRTYHAAGEARCERLGPKSVDLVVRDYPHLPERFRECMAGWVVEATSMTGVDNPRVIAKSRSSTEHVWHITYR